MFDMNVICADRLRHYSISSAGDEGWEARLEEDRTVRWRETYDDWHRVERTLARMQREVSELLERGWTIQPTQSMKR